MPRHDIFKLIKFNSWNYPFTVLLLTLLISIAQPDPGISAVIAEASREKTIHETNHKTNITVQTGLDRFRKNQWKKYRNLRAALVTNQTGIASDGESNIEVFSALEGIDLKMIMTPEHGLYGDVPAGMRVENHHTTSRGKQIEVRSLYGSHRKPPEKWMADLDIIFYDIQDLGCRTYTYVSTLSNILESAAASKVRVVVLDRPIPLNGNLVEGPILEPEFSSFIGKHQIPLLYGMTPAELAGFMNSEYSIGASLEVIPMSGYNHSMDFQDTGLLWIPTSPHIPDFETAYFYAALGPLGEGGRISEGVGFPLPFKLAGRPDTEPAALAQALNSQRLEGIIFIPYRFRPLYGPFKDMRCGGVLMILRDRLSFSPWKTCLAMAIAFHRLTNGLAPFGPAESSSREDRTLLSMGTARIRTWINEGLTVEQIEKKLSPEISAFMKKRKTHLLYQ
ncbi:MAG: hypothetical protein CVV64_04870 [Candidatus Wallbacteria bacterium HGW-Wallbacteria-1]|jgi:uncharacterized protein YbbC (DUF1343 family)|uniref:DUF1343 domain-containing protein n=1 Tax=Candidatus Wallbacteria bacterium HGW-Wallbacteria-1 TaxID=2013854 RepID=A0A2N1PRZ3_9BACT|nr:MAG: hypothetical protein CVV64_04870 [Candidatus Wallbacteria bacterium HGW-Wallbacteria-1]